MLRDREGRKLWIQTERGEFDPLESYQQIDERRKSKDGPDWWVVAKEPDWAPPKRRMSLVAGGLGGHTKPNSHGDQQPYDELGRYAGPGEGAWSEKPEGETARGGSLLTTLLGRDGDDFLAGGAGRDVLSLDGEYRAEAQGPDESRYRAKARLEDMLELPNWPSRDDLPDPLEQQLGSGQFRMVKLNGLSQPTMLDAEFAERLQKFEDLNRHEGISVAYTQGFRETEKQRELKNQPNDYPVAEPGHSLHEAGRAVDISWMSLSKENKVKVVQHAKRVGISWGGDFKTKKDEVHFFMDFPGGSAVRREHIGSAQNEYRRMLGGTWGKE